jgi:hypothetical protein
MAETPDKKFAVLFLTGDGFHTLRRALQGGERIIVDAQLDAWPAWRLQAELATLAQAARVFVAACETGNPLAAACLRACWDLQARVEAALAWLLDQAPPHRVIATGVGDDLILSCWSCDAHLIHAAIVPGEPDERAARWQAALAAFHTAHPGAAVGEGRAP